MIMMIKPTIETNSLVIRSEEEKTITTEVASSSGATTISDDSSSACADSLDDGCDLLPILPHVLISHIVSYCDAASLVQLLNASNDCFESPVQMALSNQESICMSFLLQMSTLRTDDTPRLPKNKNRSRKRKRNRTSTAESSANVQSGDLDASVSMPKEPHPQEQSVSRLLRLAASAQNGNRNSSNSRRQKPLKRLEVSNLRHITGLGWLDNSKVLSFMCHLEYLDFSGCPMLDPNLLTRGIVGTVEEGPSSSTSIVAHNPNAFDTVHSTETQKTNLVLGNLRHLNMLGCCKVDCNVVMAVATHLTKLRTVLLGGCSQTIDDRSVCTLLNNLRDLEDLDLSGLKRLTEETTGRYLCHLLSETETKLQTLKLEACEQLRLSPLLLEEVVVERMGRHSNHDELWWQERRRIWDNQQNNQNQNEQLPNPNIINAHKLLKINFNNIGMPRRGLVQGALSYFARGGCLREVHLSGCEHIQDWEVQVLATYCGHSLTCLEMRACGIGNSSLKALALHCKYLAELDVSACFRIGNEGCLALCGRICPSFTSSRHVQPNPCTRLTSLRIASLPLLTNRSLLSMSVLRSLLVLDVHNCANMTSTAVCHLAAKLPSLIELDARGVTNDDSCTLMTLLRRQQRLACNPELRQQSKQASPYQMLNAPRPLPKSLRFVNNRPFSVASTKARKDRMCSPLSIEESCCPKAHGQCCSVSQHSQRVQSAPLQAMVHCVDCKLLPSFNRGMCAVCAASCHAGHKTFVGSYTRFSCDCSTGVAFATGNVDAKATSTIPCKAILTVPYGPREEIMQHVYTAQGNQLQEALS